MSGSSLKKAKTAIIFIIIALILGATVGGFVWIVLKIMSLGINLVWVTGQEYFYFKYYPLLVCFIGGIIIGIWQKIYGEYPEELSEVMAKVKKTGAYPYHKLWIIAIAALLPLIFGGSVGPEAGLSGVIAGLCTWVGDRFKYAAKEMRDIAQIGISAALGVIFASPLFGFIAPFEQENNDIVFPKKAKMIIYFAAIFGGLGVFKFLNHIFGTAMALSHFDSATVGFTEIMWFIPLVLVSIVAGYLYHFTGKGIKAAFTPLKKFPIIKAAIGGIILGGVGILLPYTMFAGETQMEEIMHQWQTMGIILLFLTGFVKLIIANICWHSGWRGGNIFPVIFSGVCIGYAMATITGADPIFSVAVATSALTAMIMRKPLMTAMVLMLCFPISTIITLVLAAFIGSAFPLPKFLQPKEDTTIENQATA
ncbi:MAG: chloride channel protein [Clostridiales bacterium]